MAPASSSSPSETSFRGDREVVGRDGCGRIGGDAGSGRREPGCHCPPCPPCPPPGDATASASAAESPFSAAPRGCSRQADQGFTCYILRCCRRSRHYRPRPSLRSSSRCASASSSQPAAQPRVSFVEPACGAAARQLCQATSRACSRASALPSHQPSMPPRISFAEPAEDAAAPSRPPSRRPRNPLAGA